jgi:hypothetical protein
MMTSQLRWRILSLQAVLILLFAGLAGVAFWGANFAHTNVRDQLVAQKISFAPAAAISPKEYSPSARANLLKYAGQPVDNGTKAQIYANDFIGTHLNAMAGGQTYSQVSAQFLKNPKNQQLAILRTNLFMGTMLRGSLLQAYGWDQVASYVLSAAYGLTLAALIVLVAFLFELVVAPRREPIIEGKTLATKIGATA